MSPDLRMIPSIEQLRQRDAVRTLELRYGHEATVRALRDEASTLRDRLTASDVDVQDTEGATDYILRRVEARIRRTLAPSLQPVVNATGVIIHTNLGRAPLSQAAIERLTDVAGGYSNLEYDVAAGQRGSRTTHAVALLRQLTGAEAGVVVNNNAAAVLIVLATLAEGREVIMSRGEMVEIGGGFRIPDVLRQSGAILREVGTTNRTRAADYAAAIGDRTRLILRVHPSNFTISGFAERPSLTELTAIGSRFDIPVVEDLGSGQLTASTVVRSEPTVRDSIDAGVTVCTFSGDKLLGGPQAGLIVGREVALARVRTHPLMRALRVDKLTFAALEATLIEHATARASSTVPVTRMLGTAVPEIDARAGTLASRFAGQAGLTVSVCETEATIGGGSTPGVTLPSRALAVCVDGASAAEVGAALRRGTPPVIGRIEDERVLLDLLTVDPRHDDVIATAVQGLVADDPPAD